MFINDTFLKENQLPVSTLPFQTDFLSPSCLFLFQPVAHLALLPEAPVPPAVGGYYHALLAVGIPAVVFFIPPAPPL